jgi:hypothetical protein
MMVVIMIVVVIMTMMMLVVLAVCTNLKTGDLTLFVEIESLFK